MKIIKSDLIKQWEKIYHKKLSNAAYNSTRKYLFFKEVLMMLVAMMIPDTHTTPIEKG